MKTETKTTILKALLAEEDNKFVIQRLQLAIHELENRDISSLPEIPDHIKSIPYLNNKGQICSVIEASRAYIAASKAYKDYANCSLLKAKLKLTAYLNEQHKKESS